MAAIKGLLKWQWHHFDWECFVRKMSYVIDELFYKNNIFFYFCGYQCIVVTSI